jgi:hypothetical protein
MDIVVREDVEALSTEQDGWHISLFLPTERAGDAIQQNPIRLKNLLAEAEEQLESAGLRRPAIQALLEPAQRLVEAIEFWQHQAEGLAIFLSTSTNRFFRLPLDFETLAVVAKRFHIKPLLPLLSGDGRFYILALSQDQVRLLQGTRYRVGQVELEGVPTSLDEALRFDDPESRLQWHTTTGSPVSRGELPAAFYGHGVPEDDAKTQILRYFHQVDKGVADLLAEERAPMLLAGVDYLLPIYQEANSYPHLIEEGIEGNPDKLSAAELHQWAWAIVQPRFARAQAEAANRYHRLAEGELATGEIEEVVPAAYYGQVDTLFVARDQQLWGQFDPTTGALRRHDESAPGDQDLLDAAAAQTLRHGGTVYTVEPEQVPSQTAVAAVLRYET